MRAGRGAKGAGPQVEESTDAAKPADGSTTNPEPTHTEEALEQEQASEQDHADEVVRALARRVLFVFYRLCCMHGGDDDGRSETGRFDVCDCRCAVLGGLFDLGLLPSR